MDYGSIMAGQSAGLVKKEQTCKEIIEEIFSEAKKIIIGKAKLI
jgi:enoyl-[acyl-carrier protein] reductase II